MFAHQVIEDLERYEEIFKKNTNFEKFDEIIYFLKISKKFHANSISDFKNQFDERMKNKNLFMEYVQFYKLP
jgi:hypothetical protein